jgi:hypothetical protein
MKDPTEPQAKGGIVKISNHQPHCLACHVEFSNPFLFNTTSHKVP